ncbi:protein mono-ADP-ribosyltransferase PARP10 isoform X2 [Sphaeramia orbicularis]|uniref:protein mono-ADP-ribosyltransferase PARP10 isoform X2 n=1 Tax=Sphaeramia orbicularis TaxID=375764 RepID=UPI001180F878|nr:protein mono-ADP-ribosyltransferase PARP10 isoform X2 [Sphaeramia orbicularis]
MSAENQEAKTVEVLGLPEAVDEELLTLYFENRRRSGGGPLVSVEKSGDSAILVFEEAEAATQVLSKEHHVLHNVELNVRKPASKDPYRLLLRGINPTTCIEMVELYVENMMGLYTPDYTLLPSPKRDVILIHLSQPISKDFQTLSSRISKRTLDGATITLEQINETDSILVENLHPGSTADILAVYFESKRGGGQKVKGVTMLSESTAKVTFVSFKSVTIVLSRSHKVDGADLIVKPYFDFLQPEEAAPLQDSANSSQVMSETTSGEMDNTPMLTSPPAAVSSSESFPQASLEPVVVSDSAEEAEVEVMDDQPEVTDVLSEHIAFTNPLKLALFQSSSLLLDIEKTHPEYNIQITDDGVHISAPDRDGVEKLKHTITDFCGNLVESSFALQPEEAQFLAKTDVKELLLQTMNQTWYPTVYTVSDCDVSMCSVSQDFINQACSFLRSQLCHFSMPVDVEYQCMLYCREWSEFLQTLGFSFVKVSEQGGNIDVLTLRGMESKKQAEILEFLTTPIERDTFISMEPGVLKYIQIHCHQLLADMNQVSIFPLESDDVCGLKIHGHAPACQMAEEVLQGVVSSICTRTITINKPGVARFLEDKDCISVLKEMERKFQVYIITKAVQWEPLSNPDIFESAWKMMSMVNFPKGSADSSPQELKADLNHTSHNGADGLLDEAKKIVSSIDVRMEESPSLSDQLEDIDNLDLYTAEEPNSSSSPGSDPAVVDASKPSSGGVAASGSVNVSDGALGLASSLEEEAQLSLAIQYSMESKQWSLEDEEEQLQKALELSKKMIQNEGLPDSSNGQHQQDKGVSLQDAIMAAKTLQLVVFATYNSDLIRVDIAFGKKVTQRQVEERLEHRSIKNMSEFHKKCLDVIKRKHAVEIEIQGTIITVSGFKAFVTDAMPDVKLLLENVANWVSDEEVLRIVQWVWHGPASSDTTPYSPDLIVLIENAWRMKQTKIDILLDHQPHIINFEKMQECNIASGKSVKISRKLLNLGDVDGDVPEEEYSLLSNLPEASKVDEESDEFQSVVKQFYETIQEFHSKIRIIQVEKLMNRLLYNQYKLKKASVLQRAIYPQIERTLYHGTSEASVKEICIHGFNRSFCGKNATVYGQGVYFAVNSALSVQDQYSPPNADGYKFIFVSKVLTGDYTKGCHSMKTAPLKETGDIPLRYDSVTDDITKPSMFVIFNDTQAFPEYLITCQRIHR